MTFKCKDCNKKDAKKNLIDERCAVRHGKFGKLATTDDTTKLDNISFGELKYWFETTFTQKFKYVIAAEVKKETDDIKKELKKTRDELKDANDQVAELEGDLRNSDRIQKEQK